MDASIQCDPFGRPGWKQPGRRIAGITRGALVVWVSGSALALAMAAPVRGQVMATGDYIARMDADGDGRVSLAEYLDWMGYAFHAMDRNGDGVLTPDEVPGGRGPALSLEGHRERLAATFARQDVNRDGFLDARELAAPPR